MVAPVSWRIKGVNKTTRQMASDAAARSGISVSEWLERAIDNNVGILPPEKDIPLVSPILLDSARGQVTEAGIGKPRAGGDADKAVNPTPQTGMAQEAVQPLLPLLSTNPKKRPRQVPNVSPTLIAALPRRTPGNLPRILAGLLVVVLIAGGYWLVDQNTKNKMSAETDALAGRSATAPSTANTEVAGSGNQELDRQGDTSEQSVILTPLQKLTTLASSGNARAQHDLGLKYIEGNGVARDTKLGAGWLEKSANSGMPNAQYHIGALYQKGRGVSSSMESAFQWYLKAARQGHVEAQYSLGTLYVEGKGTKRNYEEAERWFTRASTAGFAEAHYSLGMIHENGWGVERDQRRAAGYYRSALAAGSARAAGKLTRLEPALKELSASNNTALLETDVTPAGPDAQQTPGKKRSLTIAGIKNLQGLLRKLDLEPGPADGVLGAKTVEAIRLYQRFAGLPVDGKATPDLLLDLRQVVGAMSAEKSPASTPTGGQ